MKSEMKREERDEVMKKKLVWTYVKQNMVLSQIPFTGGGVGGVSVKV